MEDLEYSKDLTKKEFAYVLKRTGDFTGLEHLLTKTSLGSVLVITSSRIFGGDAEKTAVLSVVMRFIYIASKVHDAITSDESVPVIKGCGQMNGDRFFVLLGDFFHSRASVILQESGIKGMVSSIADIVCRMQEARIQKRMITDYSADTQIFHGIIQREYAEIHSGCCMLGARLAGASAEEQEIMASFGRYLGMAISMTEEYNLPDQAAHYLVKARETLLSIPDRPERTILEQLVNMVADSGVKAQRMVG